MKILLAIGAGSFIGGILRYLLTLFVQNRATVVFPLGTLAVNLIGCFLMGLLFSMLSKSSLGAEWRLFLVTGILGGFTTFSAFSLESVHMLQSAQYGHAALYIGASVLLGLMATFAGIWLVKLV